MSRAQAPTVRDVFNMVCPVCDGDDQLRIYIHTWASLTPDGTDANDSDHIWDGDDDCVCACGYAGKVADFISIAI